MHSFPIRDREKRLEILEDPRLGAFGTMALVLLIIVKIALFHEILMRGHRESSVVHGNSFFSKSGYEHLFRNSSSCKR